MAERRVTDESSGPTRVIVVDDHKLFAQALAHVLDADEMLHVVGTASSLAEGIALVKANPVDVILLDYRLPDVKGMAGVRAIRELAPFAAVVVVTAAEDEQVLLAAVEAGCAGFVTKTGDLSDVSLAVRRAAMGEASISPDLLARLLARLARRTTRSGVQLTDRERDMLELIAEGLTNADIARRLQLSVHTVRNHVQSLLTKLGAHSKLEAAAVAVRDGLLLP